jgi:hypothetical protein
LFLGVKLNGSSMKHQRLQILSFMFGIHDRMLCVGVVVYCSYCELFILEHYRLKRWKKTYNVVFCSFVFAKKLL